MSDDLFGPDAQSALADLRRTDLRSRARARPSSDGVWDEDLLGGVQPQEPFLKWAGGKRALAPRVERRLAAGSRFVEPFLGSASIFLGLRRPYVHYLLCDVNADLIRLYEAVRDRPGDFLAACDAVFTAANNTEAAYKDIRRTWNRRDSNWIEHAALTLWLNRHCFNGLWRTNRAGEFNVPYGAPDQVSVPRASILAFSAKAQRAEFRTADFRETMAAVGAGDVVYLDPPYMPLPGSDSFVAYAGAFTEADHRDLAAAARAAAGRGAHVVLSNHDTEAARILYAGCDVTELSVRRSISASGGARGDAAEILVSVGPSLR